MSRPTDSNLDEARRWLAQASEDLATADRLSEDPESPGRIVCFLTHLAAEKAMKAWLISLGIPFRRVHDLAELLALPGQCCSAARYCRSSGSQPVVDLGALPRQCQ